MNLPDVFLHYHLEAKGVIHIGGEGEELAMYEAMGFKRILFLQSDPKIFFEKLAPRLTGKIHVLGVCVGLADKNEGYDPVWVKTGGHVPTRCLDDLLKELGATPEQFTVMVYPKRHAADFFPGATATLYALELLVGIPPHVPSEIRSIIHGPAMLHYKEGNITADMLGLINADQGSVIGMAPVGLSPDFAANRPLPIGTKVTVLAMSTVPTELQNKAGEVTEDMRGDWRRVKIDGMDMPRALRVGELVEAVENPFLAEADRKHLEASVGLPAETLAERAPHQTAEQVRERDIRLNGRFDMGGEPEAKAGPAPSYSDE